MPKVNFIKHMVSLKPRDLDTVWRYAEENEFDGKGFSRALREGYTKTRLPVA